MVPRLIPAKADILKGIEIMGDTPRPVFVFNVMPKARITIPAR